eukprot:3105695-Amphidinium_carterae.1
MGYSYYPETRGWEDLTMPLEAWQADCLFCEFMPPNDRKEAWLSGTRRVRAVEVGWTPILGAQFLARFISQLRRTCQQYGRWRRTLPLVASPHTRPFGVNTDIQ